MRQVPENRLLLQPTLQAQWLEQHRLLEFILPAALQSQFASLWQSYQSAGCCSLVAYLNTEAALCLELYDKDKLFALLVGTDFVSRRFFNFSFTIHQPALVWRL